MVRLCIVTHVGTCSSSLGRLAEIIFRAFAAEVVFALQELYVILRNSFKLGLQVFLHAHRDEAVQHCLRGLHLLVKKRAALINVDFLNFLLFLYLLVVADHLRLPGCIEVDKFAAGVVIRLHAESVAEVGYVVALKYLQLMQKVARLLARVWRVWSKCCRHKRFFGKLGGFRFALFLAAGLLLAVAAEKHRLFFAWRRWRVDAELLEYSWLRPQINLSAVWVFILQFAALKFAIRAVGCRPINHDVTLEEQSRLLYANFVARVQVEIGPAALLANAAASTLVGRAAVNLDPT